MSRSRSTRSAGRVHTSASTSWISRAGETFICRQSRAWQALIPLERTRLGCAFPTQVAWAPDGRRLAYACSIFDGNGGRWSAIFTIGNDGTRHERLRTGLRNVGWPAWSPDGKHIAFTGFFGSKRSAIYSIKVDGSDRHRLTLDGQAPSWSPDGRTIAYQASHGVRLVTPAGVDATPSRGPVAPVGVPAWSPDGATLAVGTAQGTYLVDRSGARLRRVTRLNGDTPAFGRARPAWYPAKARNIVTRHPACRSCL